ncbi:MAG: tyrosinase family protein [Vicinamibacterales bacterium]
MTQNHSGHDHPQTFDEVIARGFPHHALNANRPSTPPPAAPVRGATRQAGIPATRKNARTFPVAEQTAFKAAIATLVQDGTYPTLVRHHMDMSHNMHGSMGEVGLYRFLAWHRRYLVEFERQLQRADHLLRPTATQKLAVPYWRWQDPFPTWMAGFLPARNPQNNQTPPARKNAAPPSKASAADIALIVNGFAAQRTRLPGENDYTKFTWAVEGWGSRPDGTGLPAHNHGHSWIGGIMNNTSTSPTDPMFWLHHAEVDRLWHAWRQQHAAARPLLSGRDLILDPWTESYDDVLAIDVLGYAYDSSAP